MFGRRTTDTIPPMPIRTNDDKVDLNILPDLPDMTEDAAPIISEPIQPELASEKTSLFERTWDASPAEFSRDVPEPTPFVPTQPASVSFSSPATNSPATAPAPVVRPRSIAESVIGPDDFFDGSYRSERGVRLQGKVRGSIESRQYIFVEAGANVEASLSAEDITISGEFHGSIECRHRLEITTSGRVHGQVTTASLVVQEGGLLDGELHMKAEQSTSLERAA